jgi:hypothetical protein
MDAEGESVVSAVSTHDIVWRQLKVGVSREGQIDFERIPPRLVIWISPSVRPSCPIPIVKRVATYKRPPH